MTDADWLRSTPAPDDDEKKQQADEDKRTLERIEAQILDLHQEDDFSRLIDEAYAAIRDRESPTFVAEFADGEMTRMTVFTSLKDLDVSRSVCLARHAYRQRKRQEPLAIVKARFENNGKMLAWLQRRRSRRHRRGS